MRNSSTAPRRGGGDGSSATPSRGGRKRSRVVAAQRPAPPRRRISEKRKKNRDRLELYALHKQAVSGDAPLSDNDTSSQASGASGSPSSVADRAKLAAWRGKRGTSREDAMAGYVRECELLIEEGRGLFGRRRGSLVSPFRMWF